MRLRLLLQIVLLLMPVGCGQISVSFVSNPGFPTTVTGTIISVSVQSSSGPNGVLNTFTVVSIQSVSTTNSFTFCGNLQNQFPVNQQVRIDFNSGVSCATLTSVVDI